MGLNATLVTLVANTIAHASDVNTSLTNLNAANQILSGTDANKIVGHNLHGSSDSGVSVDTTVAVLGSGLESIIKVNNKYNGTNDVFINSSGTALQLRFSNTGIAARVSTNTPTTGATITWGSNTFLYGS